MELLIVAFYAGILALVAPYVFLTNDFVGKLVPFGVALVVGSALWIAFTWLGFSHSEPWIWFIVMLGMPVGVWFGVRVIQNKRKKLEDEQLAALDAVR